MLLRYLFILLILLPVKVYALIEVDITRGNLSPLPIAISPLSIDEQSKESFKKIIKKKILGLKFQLLLKII
jgi:TolB protein